MRLIMESLLILAMNGVVVANNIAPIDMVSDFPNMSLTRWGDPVILEVDNIFKEAQKLEANKKYENAIDKFNECINVIIKEKSALFVDQYINILIQIAYCYADMDNQNKALEIYKIREAILKQDKNFNKLLPDGLTLLAKEDYGQNELLAQNYQEEGIAFYHLKDLINSKNCFEEGTKIYIDLNKKDLAAKNFYYYGELSKYYQNWNELLYAGNKITSIFGKSISKEYLILSLKYKLQANINLKNYNDAKNIMQELLQIEKEINHPDYKDDLDIWNLLKDF